MLPNEKQLSVLFFRKFWDGGISLLLLIQLHETLMTGSAATNRVVTTCLVVAFMFTNKARHYFLFCLYHLHSASQFPSKTKTTHCYPSF